MQLLMELTGSELWGESIEDTARLVLYKELQRIQREREERKAVQK